MLLLAGRRAASSAAAKSQRPVSPHLQIYQPQLTWLMSGLHRITGAGLAVGACAAHEIRRFGDPISSLTPFGIRRRLRCVDLVRGGAVQLGDGGRGRRGHPGDPDRPGQDDSRGAIHLSHVQRVASPGMRTFILMVMALVYSQRMDSIYGQAWDATYALSLKNVYATGYAVQAATAVSTLALVTM